MTPNTTSFDFGDVILVPFPFTDQSTIKKRPAVVVSSAAYNRERSNVILMAITSQLRSADDVTAMTVQHWESAGLIKASVFKPLLATLENRLILRCLGSCRTVTVYGFASAWISSSGDERSNARPPRMTPRSGAVAYAPTTTSQRGTYCCQMLGE